MWIPKDEEEIRNALLNHSIEEGPSFDVKREIPKSNSEIAKDISAMAIDGGVLIYGIGEDEKNVPSIASPIKLDGMSEKISSIVRTSIKEPPFIEINEIRSKNDSSKGYLVVLIPPSQMAPHMVTIKGENRYYGRSGKTNIILTEGEVSRLYKRRIQAQKDIHFEVEKEINESPIPPNPNFSYLFLYCAPNLSNKSFFEPKISADEFLPWLNIKLRSISQDQIFSHYYPSSGIPMDTKVDSDGYSLYFDKPNNPEDLRAPKNTLFLKIKFDGSFHLFYGRAAERHQTDLSFFSENVIGLCLRFFEIIGQIFEKITFNGNIDIGIGISGLKDSVIYTQNIFFLDYARRFVEDRYINIFQTSSNQVGPDKLEITKKLLTRLFDAYSQRRFDAFQSTNKLFGL
jgi:hypothetical protein